MTYAEFCQFVKENIKFPEQCLCFECTKCGDKHFHMMVSEIGYNIRKKCYRCSPDTPEVKIYGRRNSEYSCSLTSSKNMI